MKIGILGDLHLTSRGPSRRLDNFFETQMGKLEEAFDIFKENGCTLIFQPGDLFDSHTVSNQVKARMILFLRRQMKGEFPVYCVSGQHDISGHSLHTLKNSPLAVLQSAGVIHILSENACTQCLQNIDDKIGPALFGASFGESIPKPEVRNGMYNILVLHKMIGDRELFPGQELTKPNQFLRNNPDYDLVICGDYHYRFSSQYQGRTIVNAGCLVRKTISKWDLEHKPSVAIFDTDTKKVEFVELEIRPAGEVFDLFRTSESSKINSEKFLNALKDKIGGSRKGISAKEALSLVLENRGSSTRVQNIIDECLEEVQK